MRLEELMIKGGFSIQGLAKKAGVSSSTVHGLVTNFDKAKDSTRPLTMKKISDALGVDMEQIEEFKIIVQERLGKGDPAVV
jgi:transcriptional regulator with XRE-family HTH domain